MKLNIVTKDMVLTDSIREYLNDKSVKINNHFDDMMKINYTLSVEKKSFNNVMASFLYKNKMYHFDESTDDMYKSIDKITDKIHHKLSQIKQKQSQVDKKHNMRIGLLLE